MPKVEMVTMHGPSVYEVWIQGYLDEGWLTQISLDSIRSIPEGEGGPITVLIATFRDQAELRGLLDRIYNLNLPLLAVRTIRR